MGLAGKTPLASPDHYQAAQITDAAVFYSRLSKWDDQFEGLSVHTIKKQVWFPLGFFSLQIPPAGGHFVVDIGETLAQRSRGRIVIMGAVRALRPASSFSPRTRWAPAIL
jgi:hypothetical protein